MAETTRLSVSEEAAFQRWARENRITDVDLPESRYDYRGYWKATQGASHAPGSEAHFPDTYKQHGHPTFSVESQYSAGPTDGGRWNGDRYVPPGSDLLATSRSTPEPSALMQALRFLMRGMRQ